MRITVFGASGLIGAKVVTILERDGHDVVPAARSTGVDVIGGDGLADALAGSDALVDVLNSASWEPDAVLAFFTTAATNIAEAARTADVRHYVALSIVGVDGLPDSPYFRAKVAQEAVIAGSGLPWSIVRATQFAEFTDAITDSLTADGEVRVPDALIQPIPADEVAAAVARRAAGDPLYGIENVGGPRRLTFEAMARDVLARRGDGATTVVVSPEARYYGAALVTGSLVPPD